MMENTLLILKPDAIGAGWWLRFAPLFGMIYPDSSVAVPDHDMKIIGQAFKTLTVAEVENLYPNYHNEEWWAAHLAHMISGPVAIYCVNGLDAIARVRSMVIGLRSFYGCVNPRNLCHASDSAEAAQYELGVFASLLFPGA